MEKNNKESRETCENCQDCCGCGGHYHGFHKYFVLRWVLGIVILIIVFWLGMKIGEFKGYFENNFGGVGYHQGMMFNSQFYPKNMMWAVPVTGSSAGIADDSTTVTPKK
jgi:hypothetical protein